MPEPKDSVPQKRLKSLVWLWPCLAILYFLWEFFAYDGWFARAAEWQLMRYGEYKPTLTFLILSLIVGFPALILFLVRRRRNRATAPDRLDEAPIVAVARYLRISYVAAALLALGALISLLLILTLPNAQGVAQSVTLSGPAAVAPRAGPAILQGAAQFGRVAIYTQNLPLLQREARYLPVFERIGSKEVRYFIELKGEEGLDGELQAGTILPRAGILVENGLPGTIHRLYRNIGYRIAQPYYVLHLSQATMRLPYLIAAGEFALGAIAFLIVGLIHRRRIVKLKQ